MNEEKIVKQLFDDAQDCINAVEKALPSIILQQYAKETSEICKSIIQ